MKKIKINILLGLVVGLFCLSGCYEDQGNYEYTEPQTIKVEGIASYYELNTLVDTLKISPEIEPADREYEYFWGVYPNNTTGVANKLDTLGFEKEVNYIVNLPVGTYTFVYAARDKETRVTHISQHDLSVSTPLALGWYVLKEKNGITDYDLHSPLGVAENVIAESNEGRQLKGTPRDLRYMNDYKGTYINGKWEKNTVLITLTSEDAAVSEVYTGKIIRGFEEMFYDGVVPATINPNAVFRDVSALHFINDGKLYGVWVAGENACKFGEPFTDFEYKLSPHRLVSSIQPPVLYDELSCSFVTMDYKSISKMIPSPIPTYPAVTNLNSDLIFTAKKDMFTGFVLLKERGTENYNLRKVNIAAPTAGGTVFHSASYALTASNGITQGRLWTGIANYDVIFYVRDNDIFSCNVAGNMKDTKQDNVAHNNEEEITNIHHHLMQGVINKVAVSTYNNGRYKVYLYDVLAGNLQPNPQILEGEGRVFKIIYIYGNYSTETN